MLTFTSQVVSGHGIGRQLNYPTLNFVVPESFELEPGVYACQLKAEDQEFNGVLFFGPRGTFDEAKLVLEIHLFDFTKELEIKTAEIEVLEPRIRAPVKFGGKAELVTQIEKDCTAARERLEK